MKRIFFCILLSSPALAVTAQQLQSSAFYELQTVIHNPAFAGTAKSNFVGIDYRTQWSSVDGPKTATVFGSFAIPKYKVGVGGYLFSDKTGATTRTGISVSVAKHIMFSDNSNLSLGIENRFHQVSYDQAKLSATLGGDPAIGNLGNQFNYDAGFGALYTGKKLQLGISASQLLQTKQNNYNGSLVRSQEGRLYRHFYMNGSYQVRIDETSRVIPNFLLTYLPNAPFEYWLGAKYEYGKIFSVGAAYTGSNSINFNFGLGLLKQLDLDYSFTIYNTPFDNLDVARPTHEFMLRYNLKGR